MPTREYYAEGEVLPGATPTMLYYGLDQIGGVRRVFASSGASPAYTYDPYGAPLQSAAPITDRGYAGMLTEPNSGLGLTLYRAYNPAIGRWLSRDPAGEATDQNANLYAYVNGDAINANDPLGLCPNKNPSPSGCPPGFGVRIDLETGNVSCLPPPPPPPVFPLPNISWSNNKTDWGPVIAGVAFGGAAGSVASPIGGAIAGIAAGEEVYFAQHLHITW